MKGPLKAKITPLTEHTNPWPARIDFPYLCPKPPLALKAKEVSYHLPLPYSPSLAPNHPAIPSLNPNLKYYSFHETLTRTSILTIQPLPSSKPFILLL